MSVINVNHRRYNITIAYIIIKIKKRLIWNRITFSFDFVLTLIYCIYLEKADNQEIIFKNFLTK